MRLIPDCAPGSYLLASRIGGRRELAGYIWLEFAPFMVGLASQDLGRAFLFAFCHWSFLSVYEVGYLYNDSAGTAAERPERPRLHVGHLGLFLASRGAALATGMLVVWSVSGWQKAAAFLFTACIVMLVLLLHTGLGTSRWPQSRWVSFAWLAYAKYAPAMTACLPMTQALACCAFVFVCYGSGRVVEYALTKHMGRTAPNRITGTWFLASLPACGALLVSGMDVGWDGLLLLLTFATYHVAAFSVALRRRR